MFPYVSNVTANDLELMEETYSWNPQLGFLNEEGWVLASTGEQVAGEPRGYRPDLDKLLIHIKVQDILLGLQDLGVLSLRDVELCGPIYAACQKASRYDQDFILFLYYQQECESKYWKVLGDKIRKGTDPRDRCYCGELATCCTIDMDLETKEKIEWHRCGKHCKVEYKPGIDIQKKRTKIG